LNGWNVQVDKYRGHTRVTFDTPTWKGKDGRRFRVYSSVLEGRALVAEEWNEGVAASVAERLDDNYGGEKGRVLYLGRDEPNAERLPLAVAAWHLPPDGPLELLELDVAALVRAERPAWVTVFGATLMNALRTVASHQAVGRPPDRLAWVSDDNDIARRAFDEWGFRGLRASAHPVHNTARHYLRRIEN
jgi:hypothetical protein